MNASRTPITLAITSLRVLDTMGLPQSKESRDAPEDPSFGDSGGYWMVLIFRKFRRDASDFLKVFGGLVFAAWHTYFSVE